MTKITIVYDNQRENNQSSLESGWGFSCFIEVDGKNILFDVGWNGPKFKDISVIERFSLTHLYLGHCTEHLALFQKLDFVEFHQLHVGYEIIIPD